MKLGQNDCLDEILESFPIKNQVNWSNLEKKPCVRSTGHIFSPIIMKLSQNICLDKTLDKFENGSCRIKTRSIGHTIGKPCICSKGNISNPKIMKPGQNVFLDKISDVFENGS